MKINNKKSSYARMYLVTPGVYEKLKKCIDEYDIAELSKLNKTDETESQSKSDEFIRNISTNEILSNTIPNASHQIQVPNINNISNHNISEITHPMPPPLRQSTLLESIPEEVEEQVNEDNTIIDFNPAFNSTEISSVGIDPNTAGPSRNKWVYKPQVKKPYNISKRDSFQPVPGSSQNKNILFSKKIFDKQSPTYNTPVNIPQMHNGKLVIHPADDDVSWVELNTKGYDDTTQPSEMDPSGNIIHSNNSNITLDGQRVSGNVTHSNPNLPHTPSNSFVVKRPRQINASFNTITQQKTVSPKTRAQKRNMCSSILPLKSCKPKINVQFAGDKDSSIIKDASQIVKPFKCPLCQKRYKSKFTLNRHVITVHNDPNVQQLALEYFPSPQKPAPHSWIKMGKRSSSQAGFKTKKGLKYNRIMTVGLKRSKDAANLDDSQNPPTRQYKPMNKFKNWNI